MAEATTLTPSAIVVNGYTLVGNLSWFTEGGLGKRDAAARAKQLGAETGEDAYTVREAGRVIQYGTIRSSDATRKSVVYSLASHLAVAAVARKFAVTWTGVFELPNGLFAFISVREGAILPEGDRICDATTARTLIDAAINGGVEKLIAPASFELAGAQSEILERFIAGVRSTFRADNDFRIWRPGDKASQSTKRWLLPVCLLLVAAVAAGGWWWWQQEQESARSREADQKAREITARKAGQQKLVIVSPAWDGKPLPGSFLRACIDSATRTAKSPGGWAWKETICESGKASHGYAKTPGAGRVAQLMREMPEADVTDSGNGATRIDRLNLNDAPNETLLSLDDSKRMFLARTQESLFTGSLGGAQAPQLPPPVAGQTYAVPLWKQRVFTVEGSAGQPNAFLSALDIPGLRVNRITVGSTMRIKVEGTLYAQ